ncbi:MAG: hypothetical protein WCJ95_23230, partial [Mariniphaga sp.]
MRKIKIQLINNLLTLLFTLFCISMVTGATNKQWPPFPVKVEYILAGAPINEINEIRVFSDINSSNTRITTYRNADYQVVIHEINRGYYTEINGELESLSNGTSCLTVRISIPVNGEKW